jgi:hypothetical protein
VSAGMNPRASITPLTKGQDNSSNTETGVIGLHLHDTSLSCSKVAELTGLSVTTIVKRRRAANVPVAERRKKLTTTIIDEVVKNLSDGIPSAKIAFAHHLSVATVNRIRAERSGLREAQVRSRLETRRTEYRKSWAAAVEGSRALGVRYIRSVAADAYAWLYRNDRNWLREQCDRLRGTRRISAERVDWGKRDEKLCLDVEEKAKEIGSAPNRPQITRTSLLRDAGESMVRANITRLPRLNDLLAKLTEPRETFQVVRIERAVERLTRNGLPLRMWRIQRLANIRRWTDYLRAEATRIVDRYLETGNVSFPPAKALSRAATKSG